jgi:hypothetical protein
VKKQAKDAYMGLAAMNNYQTTIGRFTERSVGKDHEYSLNTDIESGHTEFWDQFAVQFPHKLWTLDGFRYARVLKTVAYICVDEDEYGQPVVEKWNITNRKIWEK